MPGWRSQLKQAGTLAFALAFAGLTISNLSDSTFGHLAAGLVLWTSLYPFVETTSIPLSRYWLVLMFGLPAFVLLSGVALSVPHRALQVGAALGVAVIAWGMKAFTSSRTVRR